MGDQSNKKRKSDHGNAETARKKAKQWRVPRKGQSNGAIVTTASIEPGDAGIWVTCDLHKESKCTAEVKDLFQEYTSSMYGSGSDEPDPCTRHEDPVEMPEKDIETDIHQELEELRNPRRGALFSPVRIDVQCVLFFKTQLPIQPVPFVQKICTDAFESASVKRHRWIQRLTPMSKMGKATEKGLEEVARAVLAPAFHADGVLPLKFAIRTTIRNHASMTRDQIIKQVATLVGDTHSVDLENYDLMILIEIYRNLCGMSVVGKEFKKLKRFNLAEIYDPTPKRDAATASVDAVSKLPSA